MVPDPLMSTETLRVVMYTYGMGSGHLARVNAVAKGFTRAVSSLDFRVLAPRSKYLHCLDPAAQLERCAGLSRPVDIFVCDWKSDSYVESLPATFAKLWVGLRRMGTIPSRFPRHFMTVAIEPRVRGDVTVWPIISTFRDELASFEEFMEITAADGPVTLLCENGAFPSHPQKVFSAWERCTEGTVLKCSNSPHAASSCDLNYWPIARLFPHAHRILVGGGYNSIHECLAYASLDRFAAVRVGGDDQARRIRYYREWADECPGDSEATRLARLLVAESSRIDATAANSGK